MEKQEEIIEIIDDNSDRSCTTNNDTNDNELTLHNNNLKKNDKKIADQFSEISEKMIEDPKDPKNWSRKKKNFVFLTSNNIN